jgi:hypothetical protein
LVFTGLLDGSLRINIRQVPSPPDGEYGGERGDCFAAVGVAEVDE